VSVDRGDAGSLPAREGQRPSVWRVVVAERRAALALTVLLALVAFSAIGPVFHPVDPNLLDLSSAAAPPSAAHPLGTDESGRDILSRLMFGGRVSLAVGLAAVICSLAVGVSLGATAGFRRGAADAVLMRLTDAMFSVPTIFLIITALTFIGPSVTGLVIAIGLTSWMGLARLVRGEILALREQLYVEASRALGARDFRIVAGHVLPHLVPSIIVNATLGVGTAILTESALSFLGLGIQPPAASWGNMLSGAQNYVYTLPWLAAWPGALIIGTVVAINVLGDVLRDVTDPQHRRAT
jgi:peptide/nickel transport system permease protein